jgi:hypothetical protein
MKSKIIIPGLISICLTGLICLDIGSYELEEFLIYNYSTHRFSSMEFFIIKIALIIAMFIVIFIFIVTIRYLYNLLFKTKVTDD